MHGIHDCLLKLKLKFAFMSDKPVSLFFLIIVSDTIIKFVVIPVSAGCFTFNKTFLAFVAAILVSWKFVLSVTLRRQTH